MPMNFTPDEQRLLRRLRKEEHNWRYLRWFLVVGAGFLAVVYGWVLWKVYALSEGSPVSNFLLALAYPKVLFGLTIAALFLAWGLRDWYGRPARRLLLKIIEEHETGQERKCSEQDGAANRSQPVTPEANRTPPAAGSGG